MRKISFFLVLMFLTSLTSAQTEQVDNITLELELDVGEVYIDGEQRETGIYTDLEFPYIVSGQPLGIVSPGGFEKLEYQNSGKDIFSITRKQGHFLVPNTRGGHEEIEDEEDTIKSGEFLEEAGPSFVFPSKVNPIVKVRFQPNISINSSGDLKENGKITIRNQGDTVGILG